MAKPKKTVVQELAQRNQDLEDIGLRPNRAGSFLTVLMAQNELDLPLRIKSTPAAANFLQSYHTGHSEALQQVRSDELLTAIFEDLHASKMEMLPVYEQELELKTAGLLDEEDLAMTEKLGRRIGKLGDDIMTIAQMRQDSDVSFAKMKQAADTAKEIAASTLPSRDHDIQPWR